MAKSGNTSDFMNSIIRRQNSSEADENIRMLWTERRQVARERAALEREPLVKERGLPVRSVWQDNIWPHRDDPSLGGDSPSTAWGTANVSDRPLSAGSGDARQPVGVVPTQALKAAKKNGQRQGATKGRGSDSGA